MEHHWDLGYRGLIPRALARFLGSRTSAQAQPEEPIPDATYHRVLRRHERARRSALARRILPDLAADEGLPMDIFGDDLASSDSDQEVPQPPAAAQRADERQSRCHRLARCIYLHAAKIRVLYQRFLDRTLPSPDPGPDSNTGSVPDPT